MRTRWMLVGPTDEELAAVLREQNCSHKTAMWRDESMLSTVVAHGASRLVYDDLDARSMGLGKLFEPGYIRACNDIVSACASERPARAGG